MPDKEKKKVALSRREKECLYWASKGKKAKEIAQFLKIESSTVVSYQKNLRRKLRCKTIAQAVYEGIKSGYLTA